MTVSEVTAGRPAPDTARPMRTTVPPLTTFGLAATVPFSTLDTNRSAVAPASAAVMSQGPLIAPPDNVSTTVPDESSTSRQPACALAELPFFVGRLPTTTNPLRSATSAVVSPRPPGQGPGSLFGSIIANWLRLPVGETSTMVVPVPCRLRWLLKLLTSTSPATNRPIVVGTTATPYGLTSRFLGSVDERVWTLLNGPMNGPAAVAAGTRTSTSTTTLPARASVAAVSRRRGRRVDAVM